MSGCAKVSLNLSDSRLTGGAFNHGNREWADRPVYLGGDGRDYCVLMGVEL